MGKTRLALEVAAEHQADGGEWRLVPAGQEADAVEAARAATAGPVLLVVDRAETRSGLAALLRAVPEDPGPVRILLIARSLGEWWDRLTGASSRAPAQLLTQTEPLRLATPVRENASDADLTEAAVPYFARALSIATPARVTVELPELPGRMPVLVLHAAALVALLRFRTYPVASLRVVVGDDVLDELLEHEARYWRRTASAAGLPAGATLVKQVVAASCLLGAASAAEAADAVARVPDLGDRPQEERLRWARWLEGLYPADTGQRASALQPEMMAETHVVGQLTDDPDLARACLHGLPAQQAEHALTVLARASAHQDRARPIIATALRDDLAGLGVPAARAALQAEGNLGGLLADALDAAPASADALTDIARQMPYPSAILARAHLAATVRVRESLPEGTKPQTIAEWDDRVVRLRSELDAGVASRPPAREAAIPRRGISWASPARPRSEPRPPADPLAAGLTAAVTEDRLAAREPATQHPPPPGNPPPSTNPPPPGNPAAAPGHPAKPPEPDQAAVTAQREVPAAREAATQHELAEPGQDRAAASSPARADIEPAAWQPTRQGASRERAPSGASSERVRSGRARFGRPRADLSDSTASPGVEPAEPPRPDDAPDADRRSQPSQSPPPAGNPALSPNPPPRQPARPNRQKPARKPPPPSPNPPPRRPARPNPQKPARKPPPNPNPPPRQPARPNPRKPARKPPPPSLSPPSRPAGRPNP